MTTPNRNEIETRAKELFNHSTAHLPSITPTNSELKENGLLRKAQIDLMTNG